MMEIKTFAFYHIYIADRLKHNGWLFLFTTKMRGDSKYECKKAHLI